MTVCTEDAGYHKVSFICDEDRICEWVGVVVCRRNPLPSIQLVVVVEGHVVVLRHTEFELGRNNGVNSSR